MRTRVEYDMAAEKSRIGGQESRNSDPVTNAPTTQHQPYLQRQEHRFCLVHALNNMMGYPAVNPLHVLQHMNALDDWSTRHGPESLVGSYYGCRTMGEFSPGCVNSYLIKRALEATPCPNRVNILVCNGTLHGQTDLTTRTTRPLTRSNLVHILYIHILAV